MGYAIGIISLFLGIVCVLIGRLSLSGQWQQFILVAGCLYITQAIAILGFKYISKNMQV